MPISVPCFTTIREDWNREKIQVLEAGGYQVVVLWDRPVKTVTGGLIREDIANGGTRWKGMVPPATARAVEVLNLRQRLRELRDARGLSRPDKC